MLQSGFTPEAVNKALNSDKKKPEPAPKKSWLNWETGMSLLKVGTQVGWAVYKRQQFWVDLDSRVLAAARDNQGALSEAQLLAALDFRVDQARKVSERLLKQGLCRVVIGRQGQIVYLFEKLMPPAHFCDYCDQPRQGRHRSCSHCGAP